MGKCVVVLLLLVCNVRAEVESSDTYFHPPGVTYDNWNMPAVSKISDVPDAQYTGALAMLSSRWALLGKDNGVSLVDTGTGTDTYWSLQKASIETTAASLLKMPVTFQADGANSVLIVDKSKDCIYRLAGAAISIEVGLCGTTGSIDSTLAASTFLDPVDICSISGYGNYFILDQGNNKIRRVNKNQNLVTTVANLPTSVTFEAMECYGNSAYLVGNNLSTKRAYVYKITIDYNNIVSTAVVADISIGTNGAGVDGFTNGTAVAYQGFTHIAVQGDYILLLDGAKLRLLDLTTRSLTTLCKPGDTCTHGQLIGLDSYGTHAIALDDTNNNLIRISAGFGTRNVNPVYPTHHPTHPPTYFPFKFYNPGWNGRGRRRGRGGRWG